MFPKVINIGYYKNLSLFFFQQYYNATKTPFSKPQISSTQLSKILIIIGILGIPLEKKNYYLSLLPSKNSSFKKEKKIGQKISFILRDDTITLCSPHSQSLTSTAELTVAKKVGKNVQVIFLQENYFNHQKLPI